MIALLEAPRLGFVLGARDKKAQVLAPEWEADLFPQQVPTKSQLQAAAGGFMSSEIGLQGEHRAARSCTLPEASVFVKLRL